MGGMAGSGHDCMGSGRALILVLYDLPVAMVFS